MKALLSFISTLTLFLVIKLYGNTENELLQTVLLIIVISLFGAGFYKIYESIFKDEE